MRYLLLGVQELTSLLPGFSVWSFRVKPELLRELLLDTAAVADKVMQLHEQLPYVDINALVQSRYAACLARLA